MQLKDPQEGINMQAIQVASYKTYDTYAKEKGFRDQTLSPCCVTVINTELDEAHPDRIHVFWDAQEGARYLTLLRQSYGFK
jgi:ABC-type nitrate/sulfonate/bicarbonate transport system substrate-binding protein